MTKEKLDKMDSCRHLLPEPCSEVVGELIQEIRKLRGALQLAINTVECASLNNDGNYLPWYSTATKLLE